jgi:hypothetical protein
MTHKTTAYSAMVCPSSPWRASQMYDFTNTALLLSEDWSTIGGIVRAGTDLHPPKR